VLLHGVFVPPRDALEELVGVVRSGRREPAVEPEPKRGLFGRRSADVVAPQQPPVLIDVPIDSLRLPITSFGNLTTNDARRLVAALSEAAAGWAWPVVRFAGGGALEFPGDRAVWARLDGDVVGITAIARDVTTTVERLGLFVDRRAFRPMLAVATVTESTVGSDLEQVVDALDGLSGQPWQVDTVVLTVTAGDGSTQEYERIPIGPS